MDLVIDANILFAALIKKGATSSLLFKDELHLYAPEFLLEEFSRYENTILEKTHRTHEDFLHLKNVLSRRIKFIPKDELYPFLKKADTISPDPDDSIYFALALYLKADIWTNDKRLKDQDTVKVWSTGDILKKYSC